MANGDYEFSKIENNPNSACPHTGNSFQIPKEWISITDHSVLMIAKDGVPDMAEVNGAMVPRNTDILRQWTPRSQSGMGSTNWGGNGAPVQAQAYNQITVSVF